MCVIIGKLEEARAVLNDAIKRLEESASAQQDFCKVNYHTQIVLTQLLHVVFKC